METPSAPLRITEFVNDDTIAQGLSAFNPEKAAFHAGLKNFFRLYHPIADTWRIYVTK